MAFSTAPVQIPGIRDRAVAQEGRRRVHQGVQSYPPRLGQNPGPVEEPFGFVHQAGAGCPWSLATCSTVAASRASHLVCVNGTGSARTLRCSSDRRAWNRRGRPATIARSMSSSGHPFRTASGVAAQGERAQREPSHPSPLTPSMRGGPTARRLERRPAPTSAMPSFRRTRPPRRPSAAPVLSRRSGRSAPPSGAGPSGRG